jgi:hypothetical protein
VLISNDRKRYEDAKRRVSALHAKFDKLQRELGADVRDLDDSRADLISRLRLVSKRLGVPSTIPLASSRPIVDSSIADIARTREPVQEEDSDQAVSKAPLSAKGSTAAVAASVVAKVRTYRLRTFSESVHAIRR